MMPERIQRRRTRGWRLPIGAICVSRPGKWGNPFRAIDGDKAAAVEKYRRWLAESPEGRKIAADAKRVLRGKVLCCWCALEGPCHADVLAEVANS
jgi:hypothetical protein